jgi:hypothetical protein
MLDEINKLLRSTGLEDHPGSIIYSSDSTLKKGDFYFLGQNPGGNDEKKYGEDTIQNQLLQSGEHNEYIHGQWSGSKGRIHQHNIKKMFEDLEINIEDVFSTNLSFIRSGRTETYVRNMEDDFDVFWLIHEHFLSIVQPKFIIANGAKPRDYFKNKMFQIHKEDKKIMKNYGRYKHVAKYFIGSLRVGKILLEPMTVLAIPHLSNVTNSTEDYNNYYREGVMWLKNELL